MNRQEPTRHKAANFALSVNKLAAMALGLSVSAAALAGDYQEDPEKWYSESYAPLWAGTPAADIAEILSHYSKEILTHESDGPVEAYEQNAWLAEPMAEWVAEGWLRAKLVALDTRHLNETTATFLATWKDEYSDGSTEVSCGWYLADYMDGGWLITEYTDAACPE